MTEDMISDIRAAQREKHWLQASPATIGDYPFGAVVLNLFGYFGLRGRDEWQVKTEAGWNHESNALVPRWTSAFLRAFVQDSQVFNSIIEEWRKDDHGNSNYIAG